MFLFALLLPLCLAAEWMQETAPEQGQDQLPNLQGLSLSQPIRDRLVAVLLENIFREEVNHDVFEAACSLAENPTWLSNEEERIEWADALAVIKSQSRGAERAALVKAVALVAATDEELELNHISCLSFYHLVLDMTPYLRLGILSFYSVLRALKKSGSYDRYVFFFDEARIKYHSYFYPDDSIPFPPGSYFKFLREGGEIFQLCKMIETPEQVEIFMQALKADPALSDNSLAQDYRWISVRCFETKYKQNPTQENLDALADHLEDVWKVAKITGQSLYLWKRALPDIPQVRFILELQKGAVDDIRVWELKQLFADTPHLHWCLWKIFFSSTDPNTWIPNLRTFLLKGLYHSNYIHNRL